MYKPYINLHIRDNFELLIAKIKNSVLWLKIFHKHDFHDIIYRDQNPIGGHVVTSFYTSEGIKSLDSHFGERIRNINESGEDVEKLRKEIKNCDSLHQMIKNNLLLNLKNYTKPDVYAKTMKFPPSWVEEDKKECSLIESDLPY